MTFKKSFTICASNFLFTVEPNIKIAKFCKLRMAQFPELLRKYFKF